MAINVAVFQGHLTKDATLSMTKKDNPQPVLTFFVAINERWNDKKTGEQQERVIYVPCVLFGTRAEKLSRMLKKGTCVTVQGNLRTVVIDSKDGGRKQSYLEVVVNDLEFVKKAEQPQQPQESYPQAGAGNWQFQQVKTPDLYDKDVEF